MHSAFSGDARITLDEIAATIDSGTVDAVCLTDHNSVRGGLELKERLGDRVIVGSEIRTWAGEVIGLFLTEHVPRKSDPAAVCESIKEQGGLVYVPHPFCPLHNGLRGDVLDDLCDRGLVDIVEVYNGKASTDAANDEAAAFAVARRLAAGAGSDAHYPEFVGRAYVEMPTFDGPDSFLEALDHATIVGTRYTWAEARWRTKVVP